MIYIILFFVGIASLITWFYRSFREVEIDSTLGEPHIWRRLTKRLARRGVLDNARWRLPEISALKLESES
jgi:hypothetical protein